MIQITAVRLEGGNGHEHITHVLWSSQATTAALASRQGLVDWLTSSESNQAMLLVEGARVVPVEVVHRPGAPPHVCARDDGVWTDDLLALLRF
jgi:hypothetical protein